jgi:hypothetical protein
MGMDSCDRAENTANIAFKLTADRIRRPDFPCDLLRVANGVAPCKGNAEGEVESLQDEVDGEALGEDGVDQLDADVTGYFEGMDYCDGEAITEVIGISQEEGDNQPEEMFLIVENEWAEEGDDEEVEVVAGEEPCPLGEAPGLGEGHAAGG